MVEPWWSHGGPWWTNGVPKVDPRWSQGKPKVSFDVSMCTKCPKFFQNVKSGFVSELVFELIGHRADYKARLNLLT
jgi:hypothetical protein